jgi:hypothetical protein
MIFGILTFLSALTISAVAIYYSVAGLAAIFAAAVIPIIIMGVALEVGKLVTAVWLHRYWSQATWWLKSYLSLAVFILMFITSMGIFGFLSKAHIEQTSLSQEQVALIETLDDKETRSSAKIERWRGELDRLMSGEDVRVDSLIDGEQAGLDKIYARIKGEKDALRADAKFEIEQQQLRIKQAQDRRDAEIDAAEKKFEGSLGGTKAYEDAVKKAKDNELSVASRAQAEILKINTKLDEDLAKIDAKYATDIASINKRINDLRNQANNKTQDIEGRITELEGFIDGEQKKIDDVREEKFGYEKEYRKLEAEVGPIKYIAEFIYGEQADTNLLEAAVRWVIIIIIFVFDPLAVLLLIASQYTFNWHRENKGGGSPGKPNQDPDPEPEPPYTDKEWNEAHRLNHEFDRAKKIAENVPPTLSKKNTDQYLIWPDVDPDNNVQPQEQTLHEMAMEGFRQEQQDYAQEELDFEAPAENNVEQWNDWVEAANKAAEESPEDDDDDAEFWESLTSEEQEAMRLWKAEDEKNSLKYQRKLYRNGQIEQYPWIKYLQPQPDHTDESNFKIMPALEKELKIGKPVYTEVVEEQEELKKKKEYLNWIEKEGKTQVKKSKEIEN